MHTEKLSRNKVLFSQIVLMVLIMLLGNKKSQIYEPEILKKSFQRAKLHQEFDSLLKDYFHEVCGLIAVADPLDGALFMLSESGDLEINYTSKKYCIKTSPAKKEALMSLFTEKEKKLLLQIAKKVLDISKRG